jgi:hypothetical protein
MALGWGTFFGGLGKLMGKIPIQERKERWKNELDNLKKERQELLGGKADDKKASRVIIINKRIAYLQQLLENSSDAS